MEGYWLRQVWGLVVAAQTAQTPGVGLLAARCYAARLLLSFGEAHGREGDAGRRPWMAKPNPREVSALLRIARVGARELRAADALLVERELLVPEAGGHRFTDPEAPAHMHRRCPNADWRDVPVLFAQLEELAASRSPGMFAALVSALVWELWRRGAGNRRGQSLYRRRFVTELFGVCDHTVTRAWKRLDARRLLRREAVRWNGCRFEVVGVAEAVGGVPPRKPPKPTETVTVQKKDHASGRFKKRHAARAPNRIRKERPAPGKLGHLDPADLRDPGRLDAAFRWAVERGHVPDTEHARRWVRHLGERCLRQGTASPGGLFRTLLKVGPGDVRSIRQDEEDRAEQRERRRNAPRLPARRVEPVSTEVSADVDAGLSLRAGGFRALTAELLGVQRL